jgi:acyl-CoA synthetase (AMP-forming)/AMP-acid ligase II
LRWSDQPRADFPHLHGESGRNFGLPAPDARYPVPSTRRLGTQARFMEPKDAQTIPQLIEAAAVRYSGRKAIVEQKTVITYRELLGEMLAAARAFIAAGIEPGDRVAVWAQNIPEWITAAVGLQAAGAVLVPLNTRLKRAEAVYVLEKSGARILCTVEEFLGTRYVDMLQTLPERSDESSAVSISRSGLGPVPDLPDLERIVVLRRAEEPKPLPSGVVDWAAFLDAGASSVAEETLSRRVAGVKPEDISDILFTSGTTGKPKGVMTGHGQNIRAFGAWSAVVGLREGDRYLVVNPFFHSFGYKAGWLACFMRGATVYPQATLDVPQVLRRIKMKRITVLPGPPTLYQTIMAHPDRHSYDLSSLRLAVTGAAVIPVELVRRMRSDLAFETVITGYGLTETCGIATMCRFDDDPETIATTSGRAIPGVEVRCIDKEGSEVAHGEAGEVVVRGYNVMRGYLDDEEATAKTIDAEGWLHTGDIGVMDARGYLRITDRIKDMYICGGFNCYPAEIEEMLREHPEISQAAVVGVPDERLGEVGMAFVVPLSGAELSEAEVVAWAREHMANYKVPRFVRVVRELPTNAMGKVMKFVLRDRAAAGID